MWFSRFCCVQPHAPSPFLMHNDMNSNTTHSPIHPPTNPRSHTCGEAANHGAKALGHVGDLAVVGAVRVHLGRTAGRAQTWWVLQQGRSPLPTAVRRTCLNAYIAPGAGVIAGGAQAGKALTAPLPPEPLRPS